MADDTVASLGFAVDSKPLDDAKAKLKDVSVQAKETGQAVDDFNQKASKLGTGVGNGTKQLAAGLSEAEKAAKLAGTSIGTLDSMAKRAGVSIGDMATRVAAARVGVAATATASTELGTALNVIEPAAKAAAGGIFAKSFAVTELHTALRAISPVLNQFGGGLGTIASSATLVRGSFALLAGIVGGELTIALARAADQVTRNEKLFASLAGSASSGKTSLDRAKESARSAGVDFDVMSKAIQQTVQAQTDFANKSIIYARSSDEQAKRTDKASDAMSTLGKIIRGTAADSKESNEIVLAVSSSLQKTGTLTADVFQKIRDTSEPVAEELAKIFGKNNAKEFADELARAPKTVDEVIQKLLQVKPAVDAATKADGLVTFSQSVSQLSTEWHYLLEELSKVGAFSAVASAIKAVADGIAIAAKNAQLFSNVMAAIRTGSNFGATGNRGPGDGGPQLSNGGENLYNGNNGSSDNTPLDFSQMGSSSFDESGFAGAFASGGSFVVGGSGGTDSQAVTFKATPGEVVTIATPDQAASGIASLTPVSGSAIDISDLLKEQTKEIVDAINGLKTPTAVATTATAAVAAVAAGGGGDTTAFGAGGSSGGGGGGGSQTPFKQLEQEQQKRQAELDARERDLGGTGSGGGGGGSLFSGMVGGQATALRGFLGGGSSIGQTLGKYGSSVDEHGITIGTPGIGAPRTGPDAGIIRVPKVERGIDTTNVNLDELQRTSRQTSQRVETGAGETVSAVDKSASAISSAISSGLSSLERVLGDQGGGASGGGASGGGQGGGAGFGGGDSSGSSGGFGGYNPSSDPFGASIDTPDYNWGGSFNLPSDGSSVSDFTPFDQSQMGSSSFDEAGFAGSFARGGSFIAGGDGGTDTTPIRFFATKGERIDITPAGVKTPSGVKVPSSMLRPGDASSRPVQHVTTHNKNVTIQVQAGISADTILRSRAQIARSM